MATRSSKQNSGRGEVPDWLSELDEEKKSKSEPVEEQETIVDHSPKRREKPVWRYTLKEGGQIYRINAPTTQEMIEKVKKEVLNIKNWRKYARSPHGGFRDYTQVTIFPPFDTLRVAELIFPDGTVWNSRKRKLIKPDEE